MNADLIVTLGPASVGREADLARLGATRFRLNASHLSRDGLSDYIRGAQSRAGGIPIVVDLQGAKMRLGIFEQRPVLANHELTLVLGEHAKDDHFVPLPHPEAFNKLRPGDLVSIDDDRIKCEVCAVTASTMTCRVLNDGTLQGRKGFNRAEHPISLDDITLSDRELARTALDAGCSEFALSFVADGRECDWLRRELGAVRVIAKVERRDALCQLAGIAGRADALWICRGDLGAQIGLTRLGQAIAGIDPRAFNRPVLMAGQVLEHLTSHHDPTRSEACHLFDLLARGYAGIVLSDETAIGHDPCNAVATARQLMDSGDRNFP